ncbi:pyrroline-5-carboxylate reductase [Anaerolentibacter hominis]|uniref:pyrroline-5-carboxylate reductase n=1 Tax=Anaerolentibacter hominis TaxID=3079009 RepID=UPI0031B8A236
MEKRISFIGGGNMGGAILGGMLKAGLVDRNLVTVADISAPGREKIEKTYGVHVTGSNTEAAENADILFLAVKPFILPGVLEEIQGKVPQHTIIVSIVAGQSLDSLQAAFGEHMGIVRVMPNTPALVGEGMAAVCLNAEMEKEEHKEQVDEILQIFTSFGQCELVPERLMDAVTGVSGSSPAYVFMFIEAMADAAVMQGMPRAQAYKFAAQAVLGSAKMVLETGMHPGALKDMVTSPSGTTIEGVAALERGGMRAAVIEAVNVAAEKSRNL